MSVEIELKLSLTSEHLDRLKRHPFLRSISINRAVTRQLYNVYFDTPKLELSKQRMALRLRRVGKQWLQTLKGGGSVQAGLHSRNEWEAPVAGDILDFDVLRACGAQLPHGIQKKLKPVFVTDFSRSMRLINFEGAEIELCLDSGEIRAGDLTWPISELELELKSGEPQQLFRFALTLLDIVPMQIEQINKAQYGYRLWQLSQDKPTRIFDHSSVAKARNLQLTDSMSLKAALKALIWSSLQHLQANVPGAIQKLDEEYLHQVRVALRRLRLLLALTRKCQDTKELKILRSQVEELANELGRLREWDVFVLETLPSICLRIPHQYGLDILIKECNAKRDYHHDAVKRKLDSPDFQRLLLRFGAWMCGTYWQQASHPEESLCDFVRNDLNQRSERVIKLSVRIDNADAIQLHKFRIACKKMRYCTEMFGELLGEYRSYLASLSDLQQISGNLNDISVAFVLLNELETPEWREVITLMRVRMEHDYAELFNKLLKAKQSYSVQPSFW